MQNILKKISRLPKSIKKSLGLKGKNRHSKINVYIISYPKCGRTWLRILIGKALCDKYKLPEELMLDPYTLTSKAGVLRTKFTHDVSSHVAGNDYRKLKSDKKIYKDKKVIFLVRNIKDVLVSAYFHTTKRKNLFKGSISEFIRNNKYGAKKIVTFYNIWQANMNVPSDFMLVRYEDLHADAKGVLSGVLKFIGVEDVQKNILEDAVAFSRFENMKKLEKSKVFKSFKMNPGNENDLESFKVRKGKVGGYKEYLSEEDIKYIDGVIDEMGCPFCLK